MRGVAVECFVEVECFVGVKWACWIVEVDCLDVDLCFFLVKVDLWEEVDADLVGRSRRTSTALASMKSWG